MRSIDSLIRLHRWQLEDKRRALGALHGLHADLVRQAADLEVELGREQRTASQSSEAGWTYAGYARAVIRRRANLKRSVADVEVKIDAARDEVNAAYRELRKYEITAERMREREAAEAARQEQAELNEIAINQHRQRRQA